MREIKFRGKRIDNGKWVYGSLVKEEWSSSLYLDQYCIVIDTSFEDYGKDDSRTSLCETAFSVIPETVGQYLGRKDKNGKEIYEGDILKTEGIISTGIREIKYRITDESSGFGFIQNLNTSEVIGNIYEKPELINK